MGRLGCNLDGNLNDTKFSEPMPWIGIYVAAASLACAIAMAADAIHGFRHRTFWFPCKFFTINATSLTLIAVAIKLSVDLNTAMPRSQDQLAKLSSAILICTVMGNSMPSLGTMENKEIVMNIMALSILVVTLMVNICIQLGTGAIYIFWQEHAFIMFLMLVLLIILSFTALTVPTTKHYLELKCQKKYELALKEGSNEIDKSVIEKLKVELMKYWMMAHTCSPQFVIGRSVTCTASGAFCLLSAVTLAEAMLRSYWLHWSVNFCSGESDYKWSTTLVLVTQTVAIAVGTIAPTLRWFMAINFRCPTRGKKCCRKMFGVERYWIQRLVEMKECPLALRIHNQHWRKLAHGAEIQFLDLCIGMQSAIVSVSKAVRFISIMFVGGIMSCYDYSKELKKRFKPENNISNESGSELQPGQKLDLSRFVLYLEGEDELVELMMKNNCDATHHWMCRGKKKEPKHLIQLLEMSTSSRGFKGVKEFDSDQVPSLDCEEPPNCWALPVVTLTSIAVALPNINPCSIKQLLSGVNEGLMYVKLIENKMDAKGELINMRKAADVVWLGVDLYHKWLDVDLHEESLRGKSPKEILEGLANTAKNRFMEFMKIHMNGCLTERSSKWPIKVLAANSMYRISQTILLNYKSNNNQVRERLFESLAVMISDILGTCFTNLPHVISIKCLSSTVEEKEENVRHAVLLLGKTEKILKILDQRALPNLDPDQMACIDEWRLLHKMKESLPSIPSSSESDTTSSTSSDLCLTIE